MKPKEFIEINRCGLYLKDSIRAEIMDMIPEDIHEYQNVYVRKIELVFYQWMIDNVESIEFKDAQ